MKNINLNNIKLEDIKLDILQKKYGNIINRIKEDKSFIKRIIICISVIIIILVITSLVNNYQQIGIQEATTKQSEYKEIETFLTKYNNEAENYKTNVGKVSGQIIEFKDVDKANIIVTELATSNNLTVNTNNKKEKTNNIANNIFTQDVDVDVTGHYSDIIKFLNELENEKFFVSISAVSITNSKENQELNTAKISYQIFFVKS